MMTPNRLQEIRQRKGLNQTELAGLVGTDKSMIGRLEKGERRLSPRWASRLADVLEVDAEDLTRAPDVNSGTSRGTVRIQLDHRVTFDQAQRIFAILNEGGK